MTKKVINDLPLRKTFWFVTLVAASGGFFVFDRWLKAFFLEFSGRVNVLGDWFYFETLRNEHLAFGIPLAASWIVWPAAGLIVAIFAFAVWALLSGQVARAAAFMLLFTGALSNLYDRLVFSFVIDYAHVWWWPVFNVADVMIVIAVGWLLALEFFHGHQSKNPSGDSNSR